jgi:hypothetical protein
MVLGVPNLVGVPDAEGVGVGGGGVGVTGGGVGVIGGGVGVIGGGVGVIGGGVGGIVGVGFDVDVRTKTAGFALTF